jgi:hypothetical protein
MMDTRSAASCSSSRRLPRVIDATESHSPLSYSTFHDGLQLPYAVIKILTPGIACVHKKKNYSPNVLIPHFFLRPLYIYCYNLRLAIRLALLYTESLSDYLTPQAYFNWSCYCANMSQQEDVGHSFIFMSDRHRCPPIRSSFPLFLVSMIEMMN